MKERRDPQSRNRGSIGEYKTRIKAEDGYSKVERNRVVLGELDVQALLAQEAE